MAMLAEITELLRRWDVWKRVEAAPARIDVLEKRISALEAKLQNPGDVCPSCGKRDYRVQRSERDRTFGDLGGRIHHMKCNSCGFTDEKLVA